MIDIDKLIIEITEQLKTLNAEKIILFGSYAYGDPTESSDIDLFIVGKYNNYRDYILKARKLLRKLIFKYKIGFDILAENKDTLEHSQDYFYKVDILQKGKVIYAKQN